jgi:hypothetical protein
MMSGQQQHDGDNSKRTVVQPSSGAAAKRRRAIFEGEKQAVALAETNTPNKLKEGGNIASKIRRTPEQIVDDRRGLGSHQTIIEGTTKFNANRNYVNKQ